MPLFWVDGLSLAVFVGERGSLEQCLAVVQWGGQE